MECYSYYGIDNCTFGRKNSDFGVFYSYYGIDNCTFGRKNSDFGVYFLYSKSFFKDIFSHALVRDLSDMNGCVI